MSTESVGYLDGSPDDADVIVVGAGPGGAAAAYHLAQTGRSVLLLEKSRFPREKVCGDGLTPRAVRSLVAMGIDTSPAQPGESGWLHNRGLRVYGGDRMLELDWPDLASYPNYGLVRTRLDFDDILARQAQRVGAKLLEQCSVDGPVLDRDDRVVGVTAKLGPDRTPVTFRAPVVIAADGVSGRLALALGITRRDDRPMGVAVRRYYTSPRHIDDYLESWLEVRDGDRLLPGYGWIFGMGDGTCNVGLGVLNSSKSFQNTNYRDMLTRWMGSTPAEWEFNEDTATGPIRGAGLPMAFNRTPHYTRGLVLVGDAGGMVNPFNGEGIAYAMESGQLAAEQVAQALSRPPGPSRERALQGYAERMRADYGGYYRLGKVFVDLIGYPPVMRFCTRHGMPRPVLMKFVLKLMANLTDPRGGDAMDRLINGLSKITPAV
jgi:geranylgeranyl reductase family protein